MPSNYVDMNPDQQAAVRAYQNARDDDTSRAAKIRLTNLGVYQIPRDAPPRPDQTGSS